MNLNQVPLNSDRCRRDVPENQTASLNDDLRRFRRAGCSLAAAALRVMETGDGCHRLMIAVGEWAQAVANEGNRCAIGLTEASVPWQDIVSRASDALFDATSDFRSMPNHFLTRDEFNHLARPVITRAVQEVLSIAPRDSTTKEPTPKLR